MAKLLIGGYHEVVTTFTVDGADGSLHEVAQSNCGVNPSYMAFSPDGRCAYAVNETAQGRVSAYSWDAASGQLTRINDAPAEGDDPCHITVHASGKWVLVANYSSGTMAILKVRADGGVEPHTSLSPGKNAHEVHFDASGRRLYVPCLGSDAVVQYTFDAETGTVTPAGSATLAPGAGPRHMAWSPDGTVAYVINELDCTLTSFAVDASTGALSSPQTLSTLPCDLQKGFSTAHVLVSPDGRFVYGSNRGHDSLVINKVVGGAADAVRLETVGWTDGDGDVKVPRDFTLSPDGALLVCANQAADSVTVFSRDASTGALTKLGTTQLPPGRKPCYVGWVA